MEEPFVFEKERPFHRLVGDTFVFAYRESGRLLRSLAAVYGPLFVLTIILLAWLPDRYPLQYDYQIEQWQLNIIYLVNIFYISAFMNAYIDSYREEPAFPLGGMFIKTLKYLGKYIAPFIVTAAVAGFSIMILLKFGDVENIYFPVAISLVFYTLCMFFLIRYSTVLPMMSTGRVSYLEVFSESGRLMENYWWQTFSGYLLIAIASSLIETIYRKLIFIAVDPFSVLFQNGRPEDIIITLKSSSPAIFFLFLVTVLVSIFNSLNYSSLSAIKENTVDSTEPESITEDNEPTGGDDDE